MRELTNSLKELLKNKTAKTIGSILKMKQNVQRILYMQTYQGCNPKEIPPEVLLEMVRIPDWNDTIEIGVRNRIRSPGTAIRAMCVLCQGGSIVGARMCEKTNCPLWMFRMGKNPLYGQLVDGKVIDSSVDEEADEDYSALEAEEKSKTLEQGNDTGSAGT